ncbi:MAG TPA: hypothetical protein QGG18_03155 [Rhodospirillales bacterium]|nr:hypothetical protein [Rhodospirillales bacterium]
MPQDIGETDRQGLCDVGFFNYTNRLAHGLVIPNPDYHAMNR